MLMALEREKTQIPDRDSGKVIRSDVTDKIGTELEVMETIVFRKGKFDDDPGEVHLKTVGITLKSDGLTKFLWGLTYPDGESTNKGILYFIHNHVSISYHHSKYMSDDCPLDGTTYKQITISLRN